MTSCELPNEGSTIIKFVAEGSLILILRIVEIFCQIYYPPLNISGGHHEELQIRRDSQRPGRASGRRDSGSGGTFQQRNFQHFWKSIFNTFGPGRYSRICQTENTGKIGGKF